MEPGLAQFELIVHLIELKPDPICTNTHPAPTHHAVGRVQNPTRPDRIEVGWVPADWVVIVTSNEIEWNGNFKILTLFFLVNDEKYLLTNYYLDSPFLTFSIQSIVEIAPA